MQYLIMNLYVVGHVKFPTNSMRTILWCKAVTYARHISSKIMACCNGYIPLPSPSLHLHHPNHEGFRPGRTNRRSRWKRFPVADSGDVCFQRLIYMPNVPTSTEQEHNIRIFGGVFACTPCVCVTSLSRGSRRQPVNPRKPVDIGCPNITLTCLIY